MTTPAINTGGWIVRSAYRSSGLLADEQEPSSSQYADGMSRLNEMVNIWQTQGLKLFLNEDVSVTLTAGTYLYTFGPTGTVVRIKPTRVIDAYYSDVNGIRRPLIPIARTDWDRLSQITQSGQINSYFVDKQVATLNVYFWLVPDATAATGTAHLIFQNQVGNFTQLNDVSTFPVEWALALIWGLADELATGQPKVIMDRCAGRATSYRTALEDWDVEDAPTQFQVDQRAGWSQGGFR